MTRIFLNPEGIRPGWRLLIAIALWMGFATAISLVLRWIPDARAYTAHLRRSGLLTPSFILFAEGIPAAAALLAALVMTKIERRSFADYGLPGRGFFAKRFWQGAPYGFAMMSLLIGLIALLGGFSLGHIMLGGAEATRYAVLYFLAFIVVALFEEFSFRGYLQSTLATGIGFWPAAVILSVAFGAIHLGNPGEAQMGALQAGLFGLLAAFTLRRTGSIWFAMGMHAAWDWGQTFLYSVPDSGLSARGQLLQSYFHGPNWLTGGTVGPEGSVLASLVLLIAAVAVHYLFPAERSLPE